ncbi:uncharacterized protein MYCFIDRAFT_179682 [Pseudocercospora fijiensis CIRAD86]|uniref:Uncharacterized protein n=1 Tax=Pseudocercospora fijiensis (strain CIRAD86) TaxID=383855 RepID=M3AJ19_PSEFD|nr:uncharacterized protein MYCFIDRAFT_179682 [Pseudocercospora fijiensis CIRAD86]EME77477.1 hypothetical protein MYCFIDRAFT_179682 [Pseudocercospora fijiensis CIRAD86]
MSRKENTERTCGGAFDVQLHWKCRVLTVVRSHLSGDPEKMAKLSFTYNTNLGVTILLIIERQKLEQPAAKWDGTLLSNTDSIHSKAQSFRFRDLSDNQTAVVTNIVTTMTSLPDKNSPLIDILLYASSLTTLFIIHCAFHMREGVLSLDATEARLSRPTFTANRRLSLKSSKRGHFSHFSTKLSSLSLFHYAMWDSQHYDITIHSARRLQPTKRTQSVARRHQTASPLLRRGSIAEDDIQTLLCKRRGHSRLPQKKAPSSTSAPGIPKIPEQSTYAIHSSFSSDVIVERNVTAQKIPHWSIQGASLPPGRLKQKIPHRSIQVASPPPGRLKQFKSKGCGCEEEWHAKRTRSACSRSSDGHGLGPSTPKHGVLIPRESLLQRTYDDWQDPGKEIGRIGIVRDVLFLPVSSSMFMKFHSLGSTSSTIFLSMDIRHASKRDLAFTRLITNRHASPRSS